MRGTRTRALAVGLVVASALVVPVGSGHAAAAVSATVSGSMTDANNCTQTLTPALLPPSPIAVSLTAASDASPEPHGGAPVQLTNSKVTATIPAALLQTTVDSGLVRDGFVIPTIITFGAAASNTTEGAHTYVDHTQETIHIVNGVVQPLVAAATLPNTTWHPIDASAPVVVSETSLKMVSTLNFPTIPLTAAETIECTPSTTAEFVTVDGRAPVALPGAAAVAEGNSGTRVLGVPLTLSSAYGLPVTVHWTTEQVAGAPAGQADPGTDYVPASGTVTFAPGETSKTVPVTVKGDTTPESDEYFVVSFNQPTNARMGGFWGLGFGVITNDDAG